MKFSFQKVCICDTWNESHVKDFLFWDLNTTFWQLTNLDTNPICSQICEKLINSQNNIKPKNWEPFFTNICDIWLIPLIMSRVKYRKMSSLSINLNRAVAKYVHNTVAIKFFWRCLHCDVHFNAILNASHNAKMVWKQKLLQTNFI